jgi:N-formylglutamate deformylase
MTEERNNKIFQYSEGTRPILVSMPHNGTQIPQVIEQRMTDSAKRLVDTDWYLDQLYQFAHEQGCYLISPQFHRYVIDLNRPHDDANLYPGQDTTGLCPTTQFDRQPIYLPDEIPEQVEIEQRVAQYWLPYHQQIRSTLAEIKQQFGAALLFEAHSIKSIVPRFFDGKLPDFNFGNFNNTTCDDQLTELLEKWQPNGYSKVINGRFKGGFITREYGNPKKEIHSIQLELSQATYMNETTLALDAKMCERVTPSLQQMFDIFFQFIESKTSREGDS